MLFYLLLISIPNIICFQDYQTIPLRYDSALNHLKQYRHFNFKNLLDDISSYSLSPEKFFSHRSFVSNNQTTQCERDVEIIIEALAKRETWAMKIVDAWGKPLPSGILKGNLYWVGDYDECLKPLYLPTNKTFVPQPVETQYC